MNKGSAQVPRVPSGVIANPGSEGIRGAIQDFLVQQYPHEEQGSGKGCCVLLGGEFDLDREGILKYRYVHPLD
ncbi:MAG: hypothetical protein F4203_02975 [Rhodobacteraceae bacterium]|nr:hypothetical protein [Paracoccaceae bacterium]